MTYYLPLHTKTENTHIKYQLMVLAFCTLVGTGCSSGGSSSSPSTLTLSGLVNGLEEGSVELSLNGVETKTLSDGSFIFDSALSAGTSYSVTVATQPSTQTCLIENGSGTVSNEMIDVNVECHDNLSIAGSLSGLASNESVTISIQGITTTALTISNNGSLSRENSIAYRGNYNVEVTTQPSTQECTIENGAGSNTTANISDVTIVCSDSTSALNYTYLNFESGHVRPMALTPDGNTLVAVNTPGNSLDVFDLQSGSMVLSHSIPVGLEPVAVAARSNDEIWVVNHISDSVSVVTLTDTPRVTRTLLVGDEPRDIVFAGPSFNKAFITTATRGQNHPTFDIEDLFTEGLGRADVWVFDSDNLGTSLGGTPVTIVTLFGDTPRALAVSPDGSKVYAAVLFSGNQTTTLGRDSISSKPEPTQNVEGDTQPDTGLIVKYNGSQWLDDGNNDWSDRVKFSLPDYDVFEINANLTTPVVAERFSGVGTTLFNMVVHPTSGRVYVSNTEARNHVRFEGPGTISTTVRGHTAENRITVINGNTVTPVRLNSHVNFNVAQGDSIPAADKAKSLAQPMEMVISPDGNTLYLAAFGSNKIGFINVSSLDNNSYVANASNQLELSGGGTSGVLLNATGTTLYAFTRFNNSISAINTTNKEVIQEVALFDMEPAIVTQGRKFLYDANLTSNNGTSSCGSCHVFADFDNLAWDLGNPDEHVVDNPNEFVVNFGNSSSTFHPMKGPMTTQTFRGINDSGTMHWRGDRTGSNRVNGESIESAAFKEFSPAFVGLVGRETELSSVEMQAFTDFSLRIESPPNPIRALDNSLTASQQVGENTFFNEITTGGTAECNHCHIIDKAAKQFGTGGLNNIEGPSITEDFKTPHFRNLYQKVGMFGTYTELGNAAGTGDQIKGFGYLHDGSSDTLTNFLSDGVFSFSSATATRQQVVEFVMASDANHAPIVGQQVTLTNGSSAAALSRVDLLVARANAGECDLIVKTIIANQLRGALLTGADEFTLDKSSEAPLTLSSLKTLATQAGAETTFTCAPLGTGRRLGIDNDADDILDGDE